MENLFILFLMIASACAVLQYTPGGRFSLPIIPRPTISFIPVSWPSGRYSLPKPKAGCPSGWAEGWRYQDNEDSNNINSVTPSIGHHFFGTFNRNTIMYYCTKTSHSGSGSWPSGNYCIARYGGSCPSGFSTGFIYWDDEDNANANSHGGVLPDGEYNRNTKIQYCCRSDGSAYISMKRPTYQPFYLYKYTSTCQRVRGMSVREETIKMDDEDDRNNSSDGGHHPKKTDTTVVHYCYYS